MVWSTAIKVHLIDFVFYYNILHMQDISVLKKKETSAEKNGPLIDTGFN